jgi:hypothetical protein
MSKQSIAQLLKANDEALRIAGQLPRQPRRARSAQAVENRFHERMRTIEEFERELVYGSPRHNKVRHSKTPRQ